MSSAVHTAMDGAKRSLPPQQAPTLQSRSWLVSGNGCHSSLLPLWQKCIDIPSWCAWPLSGDSCSFTIDAFSVLKRQYSCVVHSAMRLCPVLCSVSFLLQVHNLPEPLSGLPSKPHGGRKAALHLQAQRCSRWRTGTRSTAMSGHRAAHC
jgi:hypothetical protein